MTDDRHLHASEQRARDAFRERFGAVPDIVASAPGRVNLIGEHTDYNDGFVLPCAISRRVGVALAEGPGEFFSADFGESQPPDGCADGSWADYPRAVAWSLASLGRPAPRFHATFAGDVPQGSGLSSSAAIECATALALDTLFHLGLDRPSLAVACQKAENGFLGVNSGIMDQYASLLCQSGAALFIDCRSLEARTVPLDLQGAGLALVVCDTHVPRTLGGTGYNQRRATCEAAAARLGVNSLRDATPDDLDRLDGLELRRARHVVSENLRVLEAVEALEACDFERFGTLMYASHVSLRDDYEVSTPELDLFVDLASDTGALGARLTGAGFGGCAIALVPREAVDALDVAARAGFKTRGFASPDLYAFQPSDGARVVEPDPSEVESPGPREGV